MSQISKALKKIQELRQTQQEPKAGEIVYLTDSPKAGPKAALLVFFAVGTLVAIVISIAAIMMTLRNSESKQIQGLALEKAIKLQEIRINDLIAAINKNQKFSDSQMRDLDLRLRKYNIDMEVQINNLTLTDNGTYGSLKEAILDDKQRIDSLDQYTKSLKDTIDKISATDSQTKDLVIPASGN